MSSGRTAAQMVREPDDSQRYLALFEVSRSIASCRDLPALFHDLSRHLHRVLTFDFLNLILHDAAGNVMRMRILECDEPQALPCGKEFPVSESPAGWVWENQQPLLIDDVSAEKRFPKVMALLIERCVKSACFLPLTTAHRRMGVFGIGSVKQCYAYTAVELEFLQLIAAQVAVGVDNALSHERARSLQGELALERDRLRWLLDLNNAAVSNLDLNELFRSISARLRRLMRCDYASMLVPDTERDQFRLVGLDFPDGQGFLREGMLIPIEGTPPGEAVRTQQPQLLDSQAIARLDPRSNPAVAEGLKSGCFLPLINRNRVLGTLNFGWLSDKTFERAEIDFLAEIAKQVGIAVENATNFRQVSESSQRLAEEKLYLEEEIRTEHNFEEIVGSSPALMRLLKQVETVAPTDSTVLIQGETGVGKEMIARAIHSLSSRRDRTFVKLNCAAIPTGLLESELFGHEKGAFTGAIAQKIGRFELAHKGTLFLDEVGDIALELQSKLLRVLQEQEFERLGGTRTQRVDVRLVAATNRDLGQMVEEKQFRSDLFYRLNVFPMTVPPLRERPEDIASLARHFVQKYARQMKKGIQSIPHPAIEALVRYQWPGNVRELEHFIERAVIMTSGTALELPVSELAARPLNGNNGRNHSVTYKDAERDIILRALEETNWIVGGPRGAAARLGLGRTTLQYKMQKLGISSSKQQAPQNA